MFLIHYFESIFSMDLSHIHDFYQGSRGFNFFIKVLQNSIFIFIIVFLNKCFQQSYDK